MNLFIGCSSSKIDDKYSILSKELIDDISKIKDVDLVFGASNSGLMGDVYNSFLNNNKKITGVSVKYYLPDNNKYSDSYYYDNTMERFNKIYEISDVLLFLPGSIGTITELFNSICQVQIGKCKKIILYNVNYYLFLKILKRGIYMKNTLKKLVLIISTVILTIVLTGCSTKTPTSQEVIDKYSETLKGIKSLSYNSDITMLIKSNSKETNLKYNVNGFVETKPISTITNITNNGNTASAYMNDSETFYYKQNNTSKWIKLKANSENVNRVYSNNKISIENERVKFLKDNANDFKVEQQGDNFILSYSGNGEKYKDFLIKSFIATGNAKTINKANLESITIKQTIKKDSFEPVELYINCTISNKNSSSYTADIELITTTSNINLTKVVQPNDLKVTNNL